MKKIELLAPAGDKLSFYSAISNGADALYLGLPCFNARQKAENFDLDNLREYVKYAHFFGVKVYLAVNTLVLESELEKFLSMVRRAVAMKVDAFIVQDLGVLKLLRDNFCDINLHASTQMAIHNLEGAMIVEKLGVKRVILSREIKLEDIKKISQNTNLELEYFVQGALCIGFSGNCYMSQQEFNKSGNRGLCKQLCRLPYEMTIAKNNKIDRTDKQQKSITRKREYLLSARDLCLLNQLDLLAKSGVDSFKIEGRLRRAGYVAKCVEIYRKTLDNLACGKKNNTIQDIERLKKVYSRGKYLEKSYLEQKSISVVNKQANNHIGIEIGEIKRVEPFKKIFEVELQSSHNLTTGDGLKLFDKGQEVCSLGVGNFQKLSKDMYKIYTSRRLRDGYKVHLILDSEQEKSCTQKVRKVPVSIYAELVSGKEIYLKAESGKTCVEIKSDFLLESAKTQETTKNDIENQLKKMGASDFEVNKIVVIAEGIFVAKSALNSLRRDLINLLKDEVIKDFELDILAKEDSCKNNSILPISMVNDVKNDILSTDLVDSTKSVDTNELIEISETSPKNDVELEIEEYNNCSTDKLNVLWCYSDSLNLKELLGELLNDKTQTVIALCPSEYNVIGILKLKESIKKVNAEILATNQNVKFALSLPNVAMSKDISKLKQVVSNLKSEFDYLLIENLWGYSFAELGYKILVGSLMNVSNSIAMKLHKDLGAIAIKGCPDFGGEFEESIEYFNYQLPLMTLCSCMVKTVYENECDKCKYDDNMILKREGKSYRVKKLKIANCYFQLFEI